MESENAGFRVDAGGGEADAVGGFRFLNTNVLTFDRDICGVLRVLRVCRTRIGLSSAL